MNPCVRLALAHLFLLLWSPLLHRAGAAESQPLFRNAAAPLEQRLDDLLSRLTLEEKVHLCHGNFVSGGIERLGIGPLQMLDGRQGVRPMDKGATRTTSLPCALSLACTWDEAAVRDFGGLLAEEMLALRQHVLLAPMINLVRSPLGGRNFENFGEDPYLAAQMTVAYIDGVQRQGVGACSCLIVANDYEARRHFTSSNLDDRTLREVHLLPSELSVREGKVWTMMSAISLFNGVHCAHHRRLLQEIVKDEIGFDGVMITDWRAAYEPIAAALAGTDMTTGFCGYVFGDGRFLEAVKTGRIPAALFEDKVRRILRLYLRCGVLDPERRAPGGLDTPAHRALARRLGAEGMVLLKNKQDLLPLEPSRLKRILFTGPGAETVPQGGGSGKVPAAVEVTPLAGLRAALGNTCEIVHLPWSEPRAAAVAKGNLEWSQPSKAKAKAKGGQPAAPARPLKPTLAALREAAKSVDTVVFIATGHPYSEGTDLRDMDLPDEQGAAIDALAQVNPRVVVVLVSAGALNLEPWVDRVPAILGAWYAGQASGDALADVLTGKVNPGGKLCFTFGRRLEDYPVHALNEWKARLILDQDPGNPGFKPEERRAIHAFDGDYKEGVFVGYRWFDEKRLEPRFAFGHGLSYTTFTLSELTVESAGENLRVSCQVANTGRRSGTEVVQVYLAPPKAAVPRPPRELRGFAKVSLAPGESRRVEIRLRPSALAYYDTPSGKWKAEAGDYSVQVGVSSRDLPLRSNLRLPVDRWIDHY